jgi:vancomycin resistance protein YoaR
MSDADPRPADAPVAWLASTEGLLPADPAAGDDASPEPDLPATVAPLAPAEPQRRGVPWRRFLVSFALGLLLTGTVAAGAISAYERQYADRILPNIHVGSVDVSGLTRAQARDRLGVVFKGLADGAVTIHVGDMVTRIPYADLRRGPDVDAMVDAAFRAGRTGWPVERLLGELRTARDGAVITPSVTLDPAVLQGRIRAIAASATWAAVDASATVTTSGFAAMPSRTGQAVDPGGAAADAIRTLTSLDAPQNVDVTLAVTPILPTVTDASAETAISQAALMAGDVVLADGPDSWRISGSTVHDWLSFTVINNRVRVLVDAKAALAVLKPLALQIDRPPVDAVIRLDKSGAIVLAAPSVVGRTLNASKTTTVVVNALRNRGLGTIAPGAPVTPVLTLTDPALTTDEAVAAIPQMTAISSWTTKYQPSERNGNGANIRIPTATINGYVVGPGETFSFWKAVGPVTKELGYQTGGAIIDGHTEPQGALGGGICSCSTTLFNAALRAGFAMGHRLNHFYYISRYPLGLDATVFISAGGVAQDMTWTNDTDNPVVIRGINGPGYVRFVLYSVPTGRTTTFTDPVVTNYTTAHTETRVDKTIPRGTTKQIEYATDGQDVWVTRTVTGASGATIHVDKYYSHYATITGIILTNP